MSLCIVQIYTLRELKSFLQALTSAKSVQDIRKAHRGFLGSAAEVCMASDKSSWLMIYNALRKLLDMTLRLHAVGKLYEVSLASLTEFGREGPRLCSWPRSK